jgi:hypothetical protein
MLHGEYATPNASGAATDAMAHTIPHAGDPESLRGADHQNGQLAKLERIAQLALV